MTAVYLTLVFVSVYKTLIIEIMNNVQQNSAEIFQQENCSRDFIVNAGIHFLLAMYGAPKSEHSIDN